MSELSCPVCGHQLKLKYRLKFNVYQCPDCGLYNSDARFEYSFKSNLESDSRDVGLKNLRIRNFATIIEELKIIYGDKINSIKGLEIGSGNGWWLQSCKENNIRCTGIEPERIYEDYHKQNHLDILYGFYPEVGAEQANGYDFIIFNDVFEHIPDINGLVENLKKDIKADGFIIINIPMSTGFFYKMATLLRKFGVKSFLTRLWQFDFHSPHMNYFNESNLSMLMEKHGLNKVKVLDLESLDFPSMKERIMADKAMGKFKASTLAFALKLMKPIIKGSKPDTRVFFFKQKV